MTTAVGATVVAAWLLRIEHSLSSARCHARHYLNTLAPQPSHCCSSHCITRGSGRGVTEATKSHKQEHSYWAANKKEDYSSSG